MNSIANAQQATKPEWALSRRERKRRALLAAGIKPRRLHWQVAAGIVIVAGGVAFAMSANAPAIVEPTAQSETAAPKPKRVLDIDTAIVAETQLISTVRVTGSIATQRTLSVVSQVGGTVQSVNFRVGDAVEAGDVLVQLDVESSTIQLAQQKATAASTRAQLAQAEGQLSRTESLAARGLATTSTLEGDRASVEAQRAALEALEAQVSSAAIAIRNATIIAPFSGIVASRTVEPGQIIGSGAVLMEVVDCQSARDKDPLSASNRDPLRSF